MRNILISIVIMTTTACLLTAVPSASAAQNHHGVAPIAGRASPFAAERQLLLITGARLRSLPINGTSGSLIDTSAAAAASPLIRIRAGSRDLEVPLDALGYLNHGLDPRLFDIGELGRLESSGKLPVTVTFAGRPPAIPGLVVTSRRQNQLKGFFTVGSARSFGAALTRQFTADHDSDAYGKDGLFGHDTRIWLSGSRPVPNPAPEHGFKLDTLTVKATNLNGNPDSGDSLMILNADNGWRFTSFTNDIGFTFYHGTLKLSVPAGHYFAIATFSVRQGFRAVVLPQFVVGRTHTTMRIAAASASSEVSITTPRPAVTDIDSFSVMRTSQVSTASLGVSYAWSAGSRMWVNPLHSKVTAGRMYSSTTAALTAPQTVRPGYDYYLDFPAPPGTIVPQRFRVTPADVATVDERIAADLPSPGLLGLTGENLSQRYGGVGFGDLTELRVPSTRTQYFTAGHGIMWNIKACTSVQDFHFPLNCTTDAWRAFSGGEHLTENWDSYPLHPAPNTRVSGEAKAFGVQPSALRRGNELTLNWTSFSDNQFGHLGYGLYGAADAVRGTYTVNQDGKRIAGGKAGSEGGVIGPVRLSGRPSRLSFTLRTTMLDPGFQLSPGSTTTWTWRSARDPSARVPMGWYCSFVKRQGGFRPVRNCAVQPLMTLNYLVRNISLRGRTRPGRQEIYVTAGHLQLTRAARITGARAEASFNSGQSWHPVRVTRAGPSRFLLSFTAPAGVEVSTRVSVTDAVGGSITETIERGYATSGRAAATVLTAFHQSTTGTPSSQPTLNAACPSILVTDQVACFTLVNPAFTPGSGPTGWSATALERAYHLPVSRDSHQTVAVSTIFNNPHLASDLATYRHQFGLPPCTEANGCLRIVNQNGEATPLPMTAFDGWDLEAVVDVSMVSAACPRCKILVIEANNETVSDLGKTQATAAKLGASVIDDSYGIEESGRVMTHQKAFTQPGHMIVAASGAYGDTVANFPANLATVTAVGGTELAKAKTARGYAESVWDTPGQYGSGSGCSAYVTRPPWQHANACPGRTIADVSADAANIAVYDPAWGGWVKVWGTSPAAAFIAGVYGLAGNTGTITPRHLYRFGTAFFDITKGNNAVWSTPANICENSYLCRAIKGYDAPTGLGTPNGISGF